LFPIEPDFPEGVIYTPDFLSVNGEEELYKEILKVELRKMIFHGCQLIAEPTGYSLITSSANSDGARCNGSREPGGF